MGKASRRTDAELDALYEQVPVIECQGLCTDSCGPVEGGHREMVRIRQAGVRLPDRDQALRQMIANDGEYTCPALADGRCSVYAVRPMICRIWGVSDDLPCPYDCPILLGGRRLTTAESLALIEAARTAGTAERPLTVAEFEAMLKHPTARAVYRRLISRPTATHPLLRGRARPAGRDAPRGTGPA